jgi:hypothetical protein
VCIDISKWKIILPLPHPLSLWHCQQPWWPSIHEASHKLVYMVNPVQHCVDKADKDNAGLQINLTSQCSHQSTEIVNKWIEPVWAK